MPKERDATGVKHQTASPLRYWIWQRISDRLVGRRDARALADTGEQPPLTSTTTQRLPFPREEVIAQFGQQRVEKVRSQLEADTAEAQEQLSHLRQAQRTAQQRAIELGKRLETEFDPSGKVDERRQGEEAATLEVVRARRSRELALRRDAVAAEVTACRQEEARAAAEIARLEGLIDSRESVARAQEAMIDAYVRRRQATYLTRIWRDSPHARLTVIGAAPRRLQQSRPTKGIAADREES